MYVCLNPHRVDEYGFSIPQALESYKEAMDEYGVVLNRRSMKWSKLLQGKADIEKSLTGRFGHGFSVSHT